MQVLNLHCIQVVKQQLPSRKELQAFLHEVAVLSRIRHRNIVQLVSQITVLQACRKHVFCYGERLFVCILADRHLT